MEESHKSRKESLPFTWGVVCTLPAKTHEFIWKELFPQSLGWHVAEKAMAPHSSTLAWKIPQAEEPGRLQSMGLLKVALSHV